MSVIRQHSILRFDFMFVKACGSCVVVRTLMPYFSSLSCSAQKVRSQRASGPVKPCALAYYLEFPNDLIISFAGFLMKA
jgi:hypothetical protein